jgi:hypothetical protein
LGKFVDGKVVQQEIGKVAEGYKQAVRNELGDLDESRWERDARGNPRDPWSEQMYLPMEDAETGEIAVFVTGSHGGKGAIRALLNVAGRNLDKGPVIRLAVSSYRHRTFGRIETPDFPVVSWTGSSGVVEKPAVAEETQRRDSLHPLGRVDAEPIGLARHCARFRRPDEPGPGC